MTDKFLFEHIVDACEGLTDKQLSNLVLAIREIQSERENQKVVELVESKGMI